MGEARPLIRGALSPRPYRPGDREGCLAVFDSNVPGAFTPEERGAFEAFLDDLPGPYLVLDGPGRGVVACGGWALAPDGTADLCWGMVLRDLQGRGLGRVLLEARLERIRASGDVGGVELRTAPATAGFYRRLGFRLRGRVPDGVAPGVDLLHMRLTTEGPSPGSGA